MHFPRPKVITCVFFLGPRYRIALHTLGKNLAPPLSLMHTGCWQPAWPPQSQLRVLRGGAHGRSRPFPSTAGKRVLPHLHATCRQVQPLQLTDVLAAALLQLEHPPRESLLLDPSGEVAQRDKPLGSGVDDCAHGVPAAVRLSGVELDLVLPSLHRARQPSRGDTLRVRGRNSSKKGLPLSLPPYLRCPPPRLPLLKPNPLFFSSNLSLSTSKP